MKIDISNTRLEVIGFGSVPASAEESRTMARYILELQKQEPVAWKCAKSGPCGYVVTLSKVVADSWESKGWLGIPLYTAPPVVPKQEPVRYLNSFSGACVTLDQQPDAATDTAVYQPLYTHPASSTEPDNGEALMTPLFREWRKASNGQPELPLGEIAEYWVCWKGQNDGVLRVSQAKYMNCPCSGDEEALPDWVMYTDDGDPFNAVGWHEQYSHPEYTAYYAPFERGEIIAYMPQERPPIPNFLLEEVKS